MEVRAGGYVNKGKGWELESSQPEPKAEEKPKKRTTRKKATGRKKK